MITLGLAQLAVGVILTLYKRELFWINILNAVIFTFIVVGVEYTNNLIYPGMIDLFWQDSYITFSTRMFGIPLDEYFWHFCLAMAVGPAYEVFKGVVLRKSE